LLKELSMGRYDHIDFTPPKGVREEAQQGLDLRKEYGRGGTAVGVARARDLSNGKDISPDTAKRMKSYFSRHEVDKQGKGFSPGEEGYPSAGLIAWKLWGGDSGMAFSNKLVKQIDSADEKAERMVRKVNTYADKNRLVMRFVEIREETATDEGVEVVIASDNPVERMDWKRGMVVSEILDMEGVEYRSSRRQLPIVDSHDPSTVKNVLGSVRELRVVNGQLVGRAVFAKDTDSQQAYEKVRDGHLTDFSITASVNEVKQVPPNESYTLRENTIEGPADIITKWTPTDASLVATGADETSTVRSNLLRSYDQNEWREEMPAERDALLALGMPEELSSPEEIMGWVEEHLADMEEKPEVEVEVENSAHMDEEKSDEERMEGEEEEDKERAEDSGEEEEEREEDEKDKTERALRVERERVRLIRTLCETGGLSRSQADSWCDKGKSVEFVRSEVQRAMEDKNAPVGESVRVTRSAIDNATDAVRDGLITRAFGAARVRSKPDVHDDGLKNASLLRMSEVILRAGGINTDRLAPRDIAALAMGSQDALRRLNIRRDGEAYHTTGTFANLLLDASNKTLLAAYEEAPFTWNLWARQATSVPDFKNVNRIRYSEAPDLEVVPENAPYSEAVMSDEKESYSVEKYGRVASVSWETIINDDLDAISRTPALMGAAARRTQNAKVYEVLTQNANMADGNALFSASHSNLDASGAAPSVSELNAAYLAMMTQTGLGGSIINVEPKYLIAPPSLRGTVLQLLGSFADPNVGGDTTGNSNSLNIHKDALIPIIEPQLEAASSTSWYLSADPSRIDTVELAFLQGEESPVLESEFDSSRDTYKYKVRQTFGVKAIDWRGLYKNPGA
jgi:hypothetical protein